MTDIRGLRWWKSSRSGNQGGNCVEVAVSNNVWYVRDSKDPSGAHLAVDHGAWRSFVETVRAGRLEH